MTLSMSMAFLFVKPLHGSSATAPVASRRATVTFQSISPVLVANQRFSAAGVVTPCFVAKPGGDAFALAPAANHAVTVPVSQTGYSSAFALTGSTWVTPPFQALCYRPVVADKRLRGASLCSATHTNDGSIEDQPPYLKFFTEDVIQVLMYAIEEAQLMGEAEADLAHILLGLIREGNSFIAQELTGRGITLGLAREKVLEVLRSRANGPDEDNTRRKSFYENVNIVLGIALKQANTFGEKIAGVEHLLLAVAPGGTARDVLQMFGGVDTSYLLAHAFYETNWQAERKYLELQKMMRYLVERNPEWKENPFKFKIEDGEDK